MNKKKAFSLIELSIVLLVIALLVAAITESSSVLQKANLSSARSMTKSSVVNDISGITLWLDATSLDAFNNEDIDDGDNVTNWYDIKSSSVTKYTASESTNYPTYSLIAVNDLPGVTFNGTNDFLSISNFKANAYMTLFVVGKFTSGDFFIEHGTNATTSDGFNFSGSGVPTTVKRSTNSVANSSSTNWFGSKAAIGVMRYGDGTNISYKKNSNSFTNVVDSDVVNSMLQNTLYIGARAGTSNFSTGSFGEIIMFDRALSNDEVDDIVEYLTNKWSIAD